MKKSTTTAAKFSLVKTTVTRFNKGTKTAGVTELTTITSFTSSVF